MSTEKVSTRPRPAPRTVPSGSRSPSPEPAAPAVPLALYSATVVLAFCSIVYELLLGQTLSAFLGNTALRYSVTIALYMLSMGIGAMLARRKVLAAPLVSLQRVELLLSVLGGGSVLLVFLLDGVGLPMAAVSLVAHALILAIGILTGLEIPLLIELKSRSDPHAAGGILGVDYLGAFAGTLVFAFWCYPRLGLVPTALGVAALNAMVGLGLGLLAPALGARGARRALVLAQAGILALLLVALSFAGTISETAVRLYLGGAP